MSLRDRPRLRAGHAAGRTAAGTGAADGAAAADLLGERRDELARLRNNLRPIVLLAVGARDLHRGDGGDRHALCDRPALEHRLPARGHRRAARRGGAARDRAPASICRAGILVILEGEGLANDATALILYRFALVAISVGAFLAAEGRAERSSLIVAGEMSSASASAGLLLRLRKWRQAPPGRADALTDHALRLLLADRAFRWFRRDRHRRLWSLCQLERAAVDLRVDATTRDLLLGPHHLFDRGPAVSAHGLPDARAL